MSADAGGIGVTSPGLYTRRPQTVEAMQYDPAQPLPFRRWLEGLGYEVEVGDAEVGRLALVWTKSGRAKPKHIPPGDWVVRQNGGLFQYSEDEFDGLFDPVVRLR